MKSITSTEETVEKIWIWMNRIRNISLKCGLAILVRSTVLNTFLL